MKVASKAKAWKYLKNGESLEIDSEACTGCGICVEVCPHGVIALVGTRVTLDDRATDTGATRSSVRAQVALREACMECGACARNCPVAAIKVKSGVGCAAAIINGKLRGTEPSCDCGGGGEDKCC